MQQTQQKPIALTPADPLGTRFCEYFSCPWKHIFAPMPAPGEKPQWRTSSYFLDLRTLWQRHQDPDTLIGLRFGEETPYALIDLDKGSPYHPANDPAGFKSVLAALEEIGLCRPLVVQSSWSGGLHVYYFFSEPLPTFALACALKFALEDAGLRLRSGQLESFPNTKAWGSFYNACRLPLQIGSYLLDDDFHPLTDDVERFLDAADLAAANQDLITLQEYCAQGKKRYKPRRIDGLPEDHAQWKRDWEEQIATGWTGHGQTNALLPIIVAYGIVWSGLSGSALEDWAVATATGAPGYEKWCRHQHEIRQRVRDWIRSSELLNHYYSAYRSHPNRQGSYKKMVEDATNNVVPFSRINEERSAQAQDRIGQVVSTLEAAAAMPKTVIARIAEITAKAKEIFGSGISKNTLWKYLTLWHPKHYNCDPILQEEPAPLLDSSELPTPPPCSTESEPQPESPKPAPLLDSSNYSHTPPYMKVCGQESGTAAPQGQPCPALSSEKGGESEGGDVPPVAAPVQIDPVSPAAAAKALASLQDLRRQTRIRLAAVRDARKAVQAQAFGISAIERERREQAAKFRIFWESGEPALMREATDWAIANPGALPDALPPVVAEANSVETIAELAPESAGSDQDAAEETAAAIAPVAPTALSSEQSLLVAPGAEPQSTAPTAADLTVGSDAPAADVLPPTAEATLAIGDRVAHSDPYTVAYNYNGIVEEITGGEVWVRWAERKGRSIEREKYSVRDLRRLTN